MSLTPLIRLKASSGVVQSCRMNCRWTWRRPNESHDGVSHLTRLFSLLQFARYQNREAPASIAMCDLVRNAQLNMVLSTSSFSTIRNTVSQQSLTNNAQTKHSISAYRDAFSSPCVQKQTRSNPIHPTQSAASPNEMQKLFQVSKTIEVVAVKAQIVPCARSVA